MSIKNAKNFHELSRDITPKWEKILIKFLVTWLVQLSNMQIIKFLSLCNVLTKQFLNFLSSA